MVSVGLFQPHVLEAVLADPQFGLLAILFRIWREIPSIDLVFADLYFVNVLHLGDLKHTEDISVGHNYLVIKY